MASARFNIRHKLTASVFLVAFSTQTFFPMAAYAITSGPTTPEMTAFTPASMDNMVDLFSGDFSYNIPLLDVGGYPLNLAYKAGTSPEDEASWVGFGWSLNPGAINRDTRGLPDDFDGDEMIEQNHKKPDITVGGNVNVALKWFGQRLPKIKIGRKKKAGVGKLKVKIGILYNNYTGYKGIIGVGTGLNASDVASDESTKGIGMEPSASFGLNVDGQSGVNPYANFEVNYKIKSKKEKQAEKDLQKALKEHAVREAVITTLTGGLLHDKDGAATVANMKTLLTNAQYGSSSVGASSAISFNGYQPPAAVHTPMVSKNFTASLSLGPSLFNADIDLGIEGSYSSQELKDPENRAPAFGFLNSPNARNNQDALLDYNMEKESPYFKRLPNLGVTVFTPDLYSVTSNAGSMQFKPFLRGAGIFFQPHKHDVDKSVDLGLEPAFGNIFHLGVPLQLNKTNNISGKWKSHNNYLDVANFKPELVNNTDGRAAYFKRIGEKSKQDENYLNDLGLTTPVAVRLSGGNVFGTGTAATTMRRKNMGELYDNSRQYAREKADKVNHTISTLRAGEARWYALDKMIPDYDDTKLPTQAGAVRAWIPRVGDYRRANHISQFVITQDDGQRMVYGVPVYNRTKEEVSFAIPHNEVRQKSGIAFYQPGLDNSVGNPHGKDNYFHRTITPAYTTGHLLSAILSPDYVDLKNDGVTDDDLGSAVKFNYSRVTDNYQWRTPYTNENNNNNSANYNQGYNSIPDDDRGNYTWGIKEIWNLHSIESKTMVAKFVTAARTDGFGVASQNGGKGSVALRKLVEIRLYSKSDLYENPAAAIPVKVVHFEYYDDDYLMTGVPNNINGKGKLALKAVWFSYGSNATKGSYHHYRFNYIVPANKNYALNQLDRWGSYKPESANANNLDNSEFPYATQDKTNANNFASCFQLNTIELPSGGIITVKYESDDYAWVQDRRAAQMYFIAGINAPGQSTNFSGADKMYVRLPTPVYTRPELEKRYLNGVKSISYQAWTKLNNKDSASAAWEFVSGYANITGYNVTADPFIAEITVGKINGKYNPIAKAAWQKLKLDLPRYAYPEYDNLDAEGSGFIKAIKALGASFGRFKDLVESFDAKAIRKGYGDQISLYRSWVRLNTPTGALRSNGESIRGKFGGGHRVQEIRINDQWSQMSGVANAQTGSYGQAYDYTELVPGLNGTMDTVSTGVASYEPNMGGDENPFREPINYTDKHFFGLPKYFYLERPMGESYFPGASVGYSKVTVRNLSADGKTGTTGASVSEFYTAKDFPTKASELTMERKQPKINWLPRLFGAKITSGVTVSQGYVVENNDMHGKQKKESVYGANGDEVSSNRYYYKVENPGAEKQNLKNTVDVINKNGSIDTAKIVGMDIEMFTEMNQSEMENMGVAVDPSFGFALYGPFPVFSFMLPLPKPNYEQRLFRGSSTIKLVNRYAILEKVVKTVNGSTSTTENLLWDSETGEVLLTKTNNEFDDPVYTFNYPAHWVYNGMGSAFINEGLFLQGTLSSGSVITPQFSSIVVPGDEIANLATDMHYWVTDVTPQGSTSNVYSLVNKDGVVQNVSGNFRILRSGRRNLAAASIGSIVSMINPVQPNLTLSFSAASKILQANAVEYDQYWPMPVNTVSRMTSYTPDDCLSSRTVSRGADNDTLIMYKVGANMKIASSTVQVQSGSEARTASTQTTSCTCNCLSDFIHYLINTKQLQLTQSDNKTVGSLVNDAIARGFPMATCDILNRNLNKLFYSVNFQWSGLIYTAQIGDCRISIRSNTGQPISFYSLEKEPCSSSPVATFAEKKDEIFNTSCFAHYQVVNRQGYLVPNSDRLSAGANLGINTDYTYFKVPGVSTIPSNATVTFARFTLYAHPNGFRPQEGFTNAHLPGPDNRFWIGPFFNPPNWYNWICGDTTIIPYGFIGGTLPAISAPFETVSVDIVSAIQWCATNQMNVGFGYIPIQYSADPMSRYYATFCSDLYPDPAKRPKLQVGYTVPNQARVTIDSCSGTTCENPVINPYTTGILGNWRAKKQSVYDTKRVRNQLNAATAGSAATHLRNSGYFADFTPFNWSKNANNAKWQWTASVQKFSLKGQEIENMDALERFSSAQYGYLESVPVAVGANARHREIGFDGFEDYNFKLTSTASSVGDCDIQDHFSFRRALGSNAHLDPSRSHSGNNSLMLTGTVAMDKPLLDQEPQTIYAVGADKQYKITNPYLRFGFQPMPDSPYVLSGWVYDNVSNSGSINGFTLKVNGVSYDVNAHLSNPSVYSKVHVVEGWKRFEIVLKMPHSGKFILEMGGNNINVDDIRIHPYNGQMKSFVYDARSMRLMAEMDENNFATFYEYDEEGTLIRVKKETEKGINTIKETRSSLRKRPLQ